MVACYHPAVQLLSLRGYFCFLKGESMQKGYAPSPVKPKSKKLVKKGYQFGKKPVEGSAAEEKSESKKVEKKEK